MLPVAPTESVEKGHPHGEGVVSFRRRETATHSTTGKNFTKRMKTCKARRLKPSATVFPKCNSMQQ